MNDKFESIRAWLILRLRELTDEMETGLGELRSDEHHHLADLEELASDVSADGVLLEQFRSSSDMVEQIQRALDRIEEGTYGVCENCGGPIAEERLDALPFATRCVNCQRIEERSLTSGS